MRHTKGPWKTFRHYVPGGKVYRILQSWQGANDPTIATVSFRENALLIAKAPEMHDQLASARAIMQKFVDKVDSGLARSTETYAEMKQWMEDE